MRQVNFESWETQDLEITFGLKKIKKLPLLEEWLKSTTAFDEHSKKTIEVLRERILDFVDYWNEDELKMQAISRILDVVDYTSDEYTIFSQRPLKAVIDDIELNGRVDFMLAKGRQKPIKPSLFIFLTKRFPHFVPPLGENKGAVDSDPKGQLLAELLAAQVNNEEKFPLYGCYVVGRNWFFVVLEGKKYAVSNALNASDEDIYQIIAILRKIKEYIKDWL